MPTFDAATEMPEFIRYVEGRLKEAAQRGMLSAAHRTHQYILTNLIPKALPHPPVDRGIYRAAWRVDGSHEDISLVNNSPHASIIEDGARATNIKIGRAALDALTSWVQRKGIGVSQAPPFNPDAAPKPASPDEQNAKLFNDAVKALRKLLKQLTNLIKSLRIGAETKTSTGEGGQKTTTVMGLSDAAARRVAWAILKNMQKKGIFEGKGLKIAAQARVKLREYAEKEVAREITREFG